MQYANRINAEGESPSDAIRIQETFHRAISEMNSSGLKLPTTGRFGGMLNNNFSTASQVFEFPSKFSGLKTYDCFDQWMYVKEKLESIKPTLDDEWSFNDFPTFGHMSGEAVSNNPSDNKIRIDPWISSIWLNGPHVYSIK